jgi:hypothetical protein
VKCACTQVHGSNTGQELRARPPPADATRYLSCVITSAVPSWCQRASTSLKLAQHTRSFTLAVPQSTCASATALKAIGATPALSFWADRTLAALLGLKVWHKPQFMPLTVLETLSARLGVPPMPVSGFVQAREGSTAAVVDAYKANLARMQALKQEHLGVFFGALKV